MMCCWSDMSGLTESRPHLALLSAYYTRPVFSLSLRAVNIAPWIMEAYTLSLIPFAFCRPEILGIFLLVFILHGETGEDGASENHNTSRGEDQWFYPHGPSDSQSLRVKGLKVAQRAAHYTGSLQVKCSIFITHVQLVLSRYYQARWQRNTAELMMPMVGCVMCVAHLGISRS